MLLARAFVLGVNSRAVLAVGIVALSVGYALLLGSAATGLHDSSGALSQDLLAPEALQAAPGMLPFPAAEAPPGSTLLAHAPWRGLTLGTVEPWPYGHEAVPGPYARAAPEALRALGLPVVPREHPSAPWDWVLVPPEVFHREFPALAGQATLAVVPRAAASPGLHPAPAGGAFYERGAAQVFDSLQIVLLAMGLVVAVLAGGVLRLEVLVRERDLATLEALGGTRAVRRAVVLRALVLVGAGVALGTASGLVLARVAAQAVGSVALRADPALVAEAALVAFAAGFLAGAVGGLARLRAPLRERLGSRGPSTRPFPGPVRFLLVTPRLLPTALAASLVLATVSSVVLAAAATPFAMFEPGEGVEVLGQARGNPLRGSADRFFGEHATAFAGINVSSPETFAPTLVEGRPVVVRGVDLGAWARLEDAGLAAGAWPTAPAEATAGARLARASGIEPGDEVLVPAAYRASLRLVRVTGIHEGAGLADDELVTDLDTAGDLAALPPDRVHLIRLQASREAVDAAGAANPVVVTGLEVRPGNPLPHTRAVAVVRLLNVGAEEGAKVLALQANDVLVGSAVARIPPRSEGLVEIPFAVPEGPRLALRVNPTANVTTAEAALRIAAPESVAANATFDVRVTDLSGNPVEGALVRAGPAGDLTDAVGLARLAAGAPGTLEVHAVYAGREGAAAVYVVEPAWALSPHVVAERAVVTAATPVDAERVRYTLLATFTNLGGEPFRGEVAATSGGASVGKVTLDLGIREQASVPVDAVVRSDARALEIAGLAVSLPGMDPSLPPSEQRPRTVAEVLAAKREEAARAREAQAVSGRGFLEDVFGALEPSVALVLLATFLHAGAAVGVAVLREVRERGEVLATLAHLGASPDQLALRGGRDALLSALPGLVAGAGLGLAALSALQPWGFPAAFGHTIPSGLDPGLFLRVVVGLGIVAALTGAWAARAPPEPPPMQRTPEPLPMLLEARA